MDVLNLLREWNLKGDLGKVSIASGQVVFGDQYAFPVATETAYRSKRGEGDFYNLQAVLFALQHQADDFGKYLPKCKEKGVDSVGYVDRKDLIKHLTNKSFESKNIDKVAPPLAVPQTAENLKGVAAKDGDKQKDDAMEVDAAVVEEHAGLRMILSREKQLQDRNSMLICTRRDFSSVLNVLNHATKDGRSRAAPKSQVPTARGAAQQPPQQVNLNVPQRGGRYDQTSQQAWKGGLGGEAATLAELGLSTEGGFRRGAKRKADADAAAKSAPKPAPKRPAPASRPAPAAARAKAPAQGGTPIVIVPSGFSTLLNLYNAKEFLEDGAYVSWKEVKEKGGKPDKVVNMTRKFGREKAIPYQILDKPPPAKSPDWKRVVAVFVQGKEWQFKGWPFEGADKGDLVHTFAAVMGIHVQFLDEPPNQVVAKWNVKRFTIDRNHRHFDSAVAREIWQALDHFLASKKSVLSY
mmetsp:Transcript_47301/g.151565  ORF Transcript_47301/g.151565 Transcript_47301/m.151565 type:complete len:465 (+) Transcript_47301:101-1495(+)